jgi:alkylation response protein AidB-like acyl-CoA dehydrogenase
MAAVMVGNAVTVIEKSIAETTNRERFGRPVSEFQGVSHKIADMDVAVRSAQLLVRHAARKIDEGSASRLDAARAKLNAGEVLQEASQIGVQLLGGKGLDPEHDMERYWREGASATIAGGTSEIHRSIIARELL